MAGTPARSTPYTPQKEEESLLGGTVAVVGEGFKSLFSNLGLGGDANTTVGSTPDGNKSPGGFTRKLTGLEEGEDADSAALDSAAAAVAAAGAGGAGGEEGAKAPSERAEELDTTMAALEADLAEVRGELRVSRLTSYSRITITVAESIQTLIPTISDHT